MKNVFVLASIALCLPLLGGFYFRWQKEVSDALEHQQWIEMVETAPFEARALHSTVVYKNKLWVIGGWDGQSVKPDIWYSSDGKNWKVARSNAPFGGRAGHSAVVFNNRLWVIGGIYLDKSNNFRDLNDVWVSDDGINWSRVTRNAGFSSRGGQSAVVFDNKLWIIGGVANRGDVWYSRDGVNWKTAVKDNPLLRRAGHSAFVFDNKIWILGGFGIDNNNDFFQYSDLLYSENGIDWETASQTKNLVANSGHSAVVFNDKIWVIGGFRMNGKVIHSEDAIEWKISSLLSPYGERIGHTSAVFNNKIWIIGGNDWKENRNDVWTLGG
jgi:N-acetylneuraminic acid mutarotase